MKIEKWLGLLLVLVITGCATGPDEVPEDTGLSVVSEEEYLLDGVFVAPGVDFSHYRYLLVTDLNLDQWRPAGQDLPLKAMNRDGPVFPAHVPASAPISWSVP